MNKEVSYPIAKLLKEKGFDEITNYNYSEVYGYIENINALKHSDGNNRFVSAPTIAEVVMWLYEKHGIWISVDSIDDSTIFRHCFSNIDFNSPTEAYEDAIEYTLNNLI